MSNGWLVNCHWILSKFVHLCADVVRLCGVQQTEYVGRLCIDQWKKKLGVEWDAPIAVVDR